MGGVARARQQTFNNKIAKKYLRNILVLQVMLKLLLLFCRPEMRHYHRPIAPLIWAALREPALPMESPSQHEDTSNTSRHIICFRTVSSWPKICSSYQLGSCSKIYKLCQKTYVIVNFFIQKLKSKHTSLKKYTN